MITVMHSPGTSSGTYTSVLSNLRHMVGAAIVAGSLFCVANVASAQGGQQYGFQAAFLSTSIGSGESAINGYGVELQLRANTLYASERFALSLGLGGQYTAHKSGSDNINIAGVFLEPRFVPATRFKSVYPYLSGRLALLRQSSNFGTASTGLGVGAGGGVAIRLSRSVNLDAGVAVVRQHFGNFQLASATGPTPAEFTPFTTYAAKIGFSFGFPNR